MVVALDLLDPTLTSPVVQGPVPLPPSLQPSESTRYLADYTERVGGSADNLFLLSRALHSAFLINHVAQVWCEDDRPGWEILDFIIKFDSYNFFTCLQQCFWT